MLINKVISLDDTGKDDTVSFYSASARYFQSLQYAGAVSSESTSCTSLDVSDVEVHYSFNIQHSFRHSLEFLLETGLTTYLPDS